MQHPLYVGTKSQIRKVLLDQAKIPYTIVEQDADEAKCDWGMPLQQVVESIARYKIEHAILPSGKEGEICFVLTADTLSLDSQGKLSGKPIDRNDAIAKIKDARNGMITGTAFCLEKKIWRGKQWETEKQILKFVQAQYEFHVPDTWIERYLENTWAHIAAGAIVIEEYGAQFVKTIQGSYTTVEGLPMYELREALQEIGFL